MIWPFECIRLPIPPSLLIRPILMPFLAPIPPDSPLSYAPFWLPPGDRGFSIGIDDVTPPPVMVRLKSRIMVEGKSQAEEQIDAYKTGRIKLKPGCDALQSLESEVGAR